MSESVNIPNEPQQISDDELVDVAGGLWNSTMETSVRRNYESYRQAGLTDFETFEEYVADLGLAAERDAWIEAGRPIRAL